MKASRKDPSYPAITELLQSLQPLCNDRHYLTVTGLSVPTFEKSL